MWYASVLQELKGHTRLCVILLSLGKVYAGVSGLFRGGVCWCVRSVQGRYMRVCQVCLGGGVCWCFRSVLVHSQEFFSSVVWGRG